MAVDKAWGMVGWFNFSAALSMVPGVPKVPGCWQKTFFSEKLPEKYFTDLFNELNFPGSTIILSCSFVRKKQGFCEQKNKKGTSIHQQWSLKMDI
ncbi:MAG: hypothetical protein ACM3O8_10460 [Methylococcaceae bacterium]